MCYYPLAVKWKLPRVARPLAWKIHVISEWGTLMRLIHRTVWQQSIGQIFESMDHRAKMKVKWFIHQHAPPPSHVPRPEKHRPITRARVGSRDRPPVLHCCYLANWGQVAAVAINATWCTLVATDRTSRKTAPLLRQHLFNDLMQNYVRSRTFASLCSLRARYQSRPQ